MIRKTNPKQVDKILEAVVPIDADKSCIREIISTGFNDRLQTDKYSLLDRISAGRVALLTHQFESEDVHGLNAFQIYLLNQWIESVFRNGRLIAPAIFNLNKLHKMLSTKTFKYNCEDGKMLSLITSSLEANGTREQSLIFFDYMINDENFLEETFDAIVTTWPWTNKSKYYLLSMMFAKRPFAACNLKDPMTFLSGIALSLKHKRLFSAGQTLMKELVKQRVPQMCDIICHELKTSCGYQLQNCIVQWMHLVRVDSVLMSEIFKRLDLQQFEKDHYRLALFRNTFRMDFEKSSNEETLFVDNVLEKQAKFLNDWENEDVIVEHIQIIEIVIYKIVRRCNYAEDIQFLMEYLKVAKPQTVANPKLRQTILKQFPKLIDTLAHNFHQYQSITERFFEFLRLSIISEDNKDCYQEMLFWLKMYETILKCLSGSTTLTKNADINLNSKLREELCKRNVWDIYAVEHRTTLLDLMITTNYDDLQEISYSILLNYFILRDEDSTSVYLFRQFLTEMVKSHLGDTHEIHTGVHFLSRLIASSARNDYDLLPFYQTLKEIAYSSFGRMSIDALKAHSDGHHMSAVLSVVDGLFWSRPIDCMILNKNQKHDMAEWMFICESVNSSILSWLNGVEARQMDDLGNNVAPTFEEIDICLQKIANESVKKTGNSAADCKILLLAYWFTLKACCSLSAHILRFALRSPMTSSSERTELSRKAIRICTNVLIKCRHKGAIESAGVYLGECVQTISSSQHTDLYPLLDECIELVFDTVEQTNYTRRGAGRSIFLHRLVKNDQRPNKPLLHSAVPKLMHHIRASQQVNNGDASNNDSLPANCLHYLCVLAKDSELSEGMLVYVSDAMLLALDYIESDEWIIRNGALQLFSALMPKLMGQHQLFEDIESCDWPPANISLTEMHFRWYEITVAFQKKLVVLSQRSIDCLKSTESLVLLLEFLARIDSLPALNDEVQADFLALIEPLLSVPSDSIRQLAAICIARFTHIDRLLDALAKYFYLIFDDTQKPDSRNGCVLVCLALLRKCISECRFLLKPFDELRISLRNSFQDCYRFIRFDLFTRCYLIDLLQILEFNFKESSALSLLFGKNDMQMDEVQLSCFEHQIVPGFQLWKDKVMCIYLTN